MFALRVKTLSQIAPFSAEHESRFRGKREITSTNTINYALKYPIHNLDNDNDAL